MTGQEGWSTIPRARTGQATNRNTSTYGKPPHRTPFTYQNASTYRNNSTFTNQDKRARGSVFRHGNTALGQKHGMASVQPTSTQLCRTSGLTKEKFRAGMIITAPIHVSKTERFAVESENLTKTCCGGVISKRRPMIVILLGQNDLLALPCYTNGGRYLKKMTADKKDDYVCLLVAGDQHEVQNIHPVIEPRIGAGIALKTSYIHFRGGVKIQYDDDIQFKGSISQEHYTILTELWYSGIEEDFKEAKDAVAKFERTTATSTSQAPQIVAHKTSIIPRINGTPADGVPMINIARGASVATRLGVTNRSCSHATDSNGTAQRASNLAPQAYNRAGSNLSRR